MKAAPVPTEMSHVASDAFSTAGEQYTSIAFSRALCKTLNSGSQCPKTSIFGVPSTRTCSDILRLSKAICGGFSRGRCPSDMTQCIAFLMLQPWTASTITGSPCHSTRTSTDVSSTFIRWNSTPSVKHPSVRRSAGKKSTARSPLASSARFEVATISPLIAFPRTVNSEGGYVLHEGCQNVTSSASLPPQDSFARPITSWRFMRAAVLLRSRTYRPFVELNELDIEEKFVRGSGRGGTKVGTTSNCVQVRHVPSGVQVRCHETRSLEQNRIIARKRLREKLEELQDPDRSRRSITAARIRRRKERPGRSAVSDEVPAEVLRELVARGDLEARMVLDVDSPNCAVIDALAYVLEDPPTEALSIRSRLSGLEAQKRRLEGLFPWARAEFMDPGALSMVDASFDQLYFANATADVHVWCELARVLRPGGVSVASMPADRAKDVESSLGVAGLRVGAVEPIHGDVLITAWRAAS